MIVDAALYRDGLRESIELDGDDLRRLRDQPERGTFIWVGLHEPTVPEMRMVARDFQLHHRAVAEAMSSHQRPKVEQYDDMLFMVVKTLWYVDEQDAVETGQVALFVGPEFVVTVRQGAGNDLRTVRRDLERSAHLLAQGPTAVIHTVVDRIVDGYEDVTAALEQDVDEVEVSVFAEDRSRDSRRIYTLKREIAEIRRAVVPLRAPMERCSHAAYAFIHEDAGDFFRDVTEHVVRITETVDTLDQLLSTAFDAHLARISVEQNEDMRRISAWVAIAAVGTLVAGVYGMNFERMPELTWRYGYEFSLALMGGAALVLYVLFKRSGWL